LVTAAVGAEFGFPDSRMRKAHGRREPRQLAYMKSSREKRVIEALLGRIKI
jgi:hypothetical protein